MTWWAYPGVSGAPQGKRAALRSSTIMLRQPLQRLGGMQASDIDIYRKITREKSQTMVGPGQGGTAGEVPATRLGAGPVRHMGR